MAVVDVGCGAVASSGNYERFMDVAEKRYCHILDPMSGWPVRCLSSVAHVIPLIELHHAMARLQKYQLI